MQEIKFKPCPFCGSENIRISKDFYVNNKGFVVNIPKSVSCMECHCKGPAFIYDKDVVKTWNIRIDS